MNSAIEQAFNIMLRNWNSMSGTDNDEAEENANEFEASFYIFIEAVREWVYGLEQQPQTLEEMMGLPGMQILLDQLPAPLHLNFETEAELIIENIIRIDEDKYD
ncbi:hypothetical protein [Paenibacillus sedimenti]|uniref:Uncharacterized protein n=1 Tax=Paenibacillus sedimenti TaxID=2770274 RepID=A0A926QGV4_9BACL|nr:hypothetical protein [Paenibacillus sedimenti]MBD0378835.1 hypothetical protein [Paenibacillus sedimenti]